MQIFCTLLIMFFNINFILGSRLKKNSLAWPMCRRAEKQQMGPASSEETNPWNLHTPKPLPTSKVSSHVLINRLHHSLVILVADNLTAYMTWAHVMAKGLCSAIFFETSSFCLLLQGATYLENLELSQNFN